MNQTESPNLDATLQYLIQRGSPRLDQHPVGNPPPLWWTIDNADTSEDFPSLLIHNNAEGWGCSVDLLPGPDNTSSFLGSVYIWAAHSRPLKWEALWYWPGLRLVSTIGRRLSTNARTEQQQQHPQP